MLDILYLVPNTADAAVARRINMLADGGARVAVAGFRRAGVEPPKLRADGYFELGQTFDARFVQRVVAVARAAASLKSQLGAHRVPDLIVARNLEMLVLANQLRAMWGDAPAIAYECLDIHRLLLRDDIVGRTLRGLERRLSRDAVLLLTSSPAFIREYFAAHGQAELPTLLVENKVHGATLRGTNPALGEPDESGPIRIGWFGALRCRTSLAALGELSDAMDGSVQIVLRGRPALTEFDDFHGFVADHRRMSFAGPYRNPDDLAAIYSDVHLAWAIDYFEAGQNSNWLLPNRIYEGCLHGAVPIALAGTETAAFVERNGIGIVLPDTEPATLVQRIGALDRGELRRMAKAVAARDPRLFAFDTADCRRLVADLARAANSDTASLEAA